MWAPDVPPEPPDGKQVSTIAEAGEIPARAPALTPGTADSSGEDPVDVVLDAIESGSDVFILYAGAEGTTQRQITPYRVEGAAVHAFCHRRQDEQSFWLASIRDAVPVPG